MDKQISTFTLGDMVLGIDILLIREVYRQMTLTKIPDAPKHLRGLMNLRGKVVTVIDLNVCLNRPPATDIENCRLLILKTRDEIRSLKRSEDLSDIDTGEDIVGFLIDRMEDVLAINQKDILPPPPNLFEVDEELIDGVIKLENHLVILLNVELLLKRVLTVQTETDND